VKSRDHSGPAEFDELVTIWLMASALVGGLDRVEGLADVAAPHQFAFGP